MAEEISGWEVLFIVTVGMWLALISTFLKARRLKGIYYGP